MNKKLRVGFDLDGVILYNPIRIFRPFASALKFVKPLVFHENADFFYFPRSSMEKLVWRMLHWTSFKIASGVDEIKQLAEAKIIEPYIITARYSFLKDDFHYWIKRLNNQPYFKFYHYNKDDLQPNTFKENMIKDLRLDIFVEDNWGVISRLQQSLPNLKIFWISNIFDWHIQYPYKFTSLKDAVKYLKESA